MRTLLKHTLVAVIAAASAVTAVADAPAASASVSTLVRSGYVSVSGLRMYYEIHGRASQGVPLVLLHGGFMTIPA